jgi:hypothetical protein
MTLQRFVASVDCSPAREPWRGKANAHMHLPPNFSAFGSVSQAVVQAQAEGLEVLGANNYYDFRVYADLADAAYAKGVFPLFGMEIIAQDDALRDAGIKCNDPGNPGRVYICGKSITRFASPTARAAQLLSRIRMADDTRMRAMAGRLREVVTERGFDPGAFSHDATVDHLVTKGGFARESITLQERHLCASLEKAVRQASGHSWRSAFSRLLEVGEDKVPDDPIALQNGLRSALIKSGKPAFIPEQFVNLQEALELIDELGGIRCYPVLADGAKPVTPFEQDPMALARELKRLGFVAAEFIPPRNAVGVLKQYVRVLRAEGLVVTAGTEHNTLDGGPLEPFALGGAGIDEETADIFREGTCVLVAHQVLETRGEEGLGLAPAPERIRHLASVGANILNQYRTEARS